MTSIVAIANLKGGVGKSTLALSLASTLHGENLSVLLIDADPQGTCRAWSALAADREQEGPPVVALDGRALRRDLAAVTSGFDWAIIDSPPRLGVESRLAMMAADLVVLPVTPGAADVWALRETISVLEEAQALRPELRAVIFINRADHTTLTRLTREALADMPVPVLPVGFGARVAFGEATLSGQGVREYAPRSVAAREALAVTEAVIAAVGGGPGV